MTPSLEGRPTKAKETPSPHEVRLAPLDTNPVFQSLGGGQVSKIPKRYKQNTTLGDFHRSRKIASNFDIEIRAIKAYTTKLDIHNDLSKKVIQDFITPQGVIETKIDNGIPCLDVLNLDAQIKGIKKNSKTIVKKQT